MARGEAKPAATDVKGRILNVAVELFARKGFEATSVREIAEAAGIAKPTLYYYFGSKEGLGLAIVRQAQQKMEDYLRRGTQGPKNILAKLVGFVEAHFRACREEKDLARFLYGLSFSPQTSTLTLDVRSFRGGAVEILDAILDGAEKEGIVSPGIREDAHRMLMGIINIHMMSFLKLGLELSRERAERAVRLFIEGVGPEDRRVHG